MSNARRSTEAQGFGSDSFLDIVANMVGILILLVLVVGLRAREVAHVDNSENTKAVQEVARLEADARGLEQETFSLVAEAERLAALAEGQRYQRDTAMTMLGLVNRDVDEFRKSLDDRQREQFDLTRSLIEARQRLELASAKNRELTDDPQGATVTVHNYPTPISRMVHGREIHFHVRDGRVSYVPLDELLELMKTSARQSVQRLADRDAVVETVGPIAGFRMKYTINRVQVPVQGPAVRATGAQVVATAAYAQLSEFNVLPVAAQSGEPLSAALAPGSQFRMAISHADPQSATITLWTYPDSFGTYRQLKEELYKLGFAVAGRPLPPDQLIGGSPNGTRSVAE